ncbi:uncharacterized protein LOC113318524 [Papaver somniferum]|uniref:uncharacterized protein LOC113318524 n=1 Tax=Papaver somniferum TaxID=3469 RepID=UPI000E70226F|nr:uncharacterized protein LOC113318524 [Papaver somniferum]
MNQTSSEDIQSNAQMFRKSMNEIRWGRCEECKTTFLDIPAKWICNFCEKDKNQHPGGVLLFSEANNMDPGDEPDKLSRLSDLEKLLIARVHPMISVYRVKGQQYKYGGNVINFVRDVNEISKVLPHKPSDLDAILIVNKTDIEINEANIDGLPEDDVSDDLPCMNKDDDKLQQHDDDHNGPPELQEQGVLHVDDFQTAGTIGAFVQPDQRKCIMRALERVEADKTNVDLPFTGEVVYEFTKVGYITMAFPTLFSYGRVDLREYRPRKIGERQYFQYMMRYHDGRFSRDSRFRYFSLNSSTKWHALSLGYVYVKLNPTDGKLSIEYIRDIVTSSDIQLLSRVSYYAKQIRGMRAYWYSRLKELIEMVKQLGSPTIFFTLSAADLQWPELYAILDPENRLGSLDPMERRRER